MVLRAANQNLSIASGNRSLIREAVAQIGTSEPIWVTDEERRNVKYGFALRKNGRNGTLYPFFGVHSASHCIAVPHPPQCAHWGTFPPGEGILTVPGSIQPTDKQQFPF